MIISNSSALDTSEDTGAINPNPEPPGTSVDSVVDPGGSQPVDGEVEINSLLAKHTTSSVISQDPDKAVILNLLDQVDQTPTGTSGGSSSGY